MKYSVFLIASAVACLLSTTTLKAQPNAPDIVVAADGSAAFTSIEAAVMSVRDYKPTRTTIFIKNGRYAEKICIPANKCDITLIGESVDGVVITHGDYASLNDMGTFRTSTLRIDGSGIRIENLTVENSAGRVGQAVALHVEGDRCEFVNCRFLGNQDTVFNGHGGHREYFCNCYIEGTTDFIFGPATVWFEQCTIHCKADSYITAASTPEDVKYGYVFDRCTVTAAADVTKLYLGRPWRAWAYTLFSECELPSCIVPIGWHNWGNVENEKTARYAEYKCTGPGAETSGRAPWTSLLTDDQRSAITLENVMRRDSAWHPFYDTDKTR